MKRFTEPDADRIPWLSLAFISLATITIQVLFTLAAVIPYVGGLFGFVQPLLAFFLFVMIGVLAASNTEKVPAGERLLVLPYLIVAAFLCFASPYIAGYYTYPVRIARSVVAERHVEMTYGEAADAMKSSLRQEVGSEGFVAYALLTERFQLSADSLGKFAGSEFEDVDDLGGFISACINTVLHVIPLLLKLLLCDALGWVAEAGVVGLVFWYLFSLTLSYIGFRTA